jgi:transcription elongation factor GreA
MVGEKKFYLTKQGLEKIKKEEEALKQLKLTKANGGSPEVLHSEDLNPEYLAFQEDMGFLETRMLELENILNNAEIINLPPKERRQYVDLGATVLAEIGGKTDEFKIVGTLEADPTGHKISNESPVGKAILGRKAGEKVTINDRPFKIKRIRYEAA